ncbi:MAG: glycosyltransferase [Actinomycetota bacterium]|nr:glycosyltransferase [Actinomycetota bacterium]
MAVSTTPTFSVIIATVRRTASLDQALSSVFATSRDDLEVIIVDGDSARSAEFVADRWRERGHNVCYLVTAAGSSYQRNQGLDVARGDIAVFLDDDAELPSDAFDRLEDVYAHPEIVGVTGRVVQPHGTRIVGEGSCVYRLLPGGGREGMFTRFGYPRRLVRLDRERDMQFMPGCFMTARRELAARVRFDEGLEGLTGYALAEDEDFSYRLSRLGRIRYIPDLVVHHAHRGFQSRDRRNFGRTVIVNRHYLFRKNFRQTVLARMQFRILVCLLVIHRALNRDWQGLRGLLEGCSEVWGNSRSGDASPTK